MHDSKTTVRPPLKWAAKVAPVKEVTLHGSADLAFWQDRLRPEGLEPAPRDGRAQLFLSATEMRFWGILFRECIVGVQVVRPAQSGEPIAGLYLAQAWNTVRFFAWVERTIFKTPYRLGQIEVDPSAPAQLHVSEQGKSLIKATRRDQSLPESTVAEEWQGPVFLPRVGNRPQQLFIAQLNGLTEHYPFHLERDEFTSFGSSLPALESLIASGFTPERWHIRPAAAHAKSKTYHVRDWYGD
jgi:hypothetical protein